MTRFMIALPLVALIAACDNPLGTVAGGAAIGAAVNEEDRVEGAAQGAAVGGAVAVGDAIIN